MTHVHPMPWLSDASLGCGSRSSPSSTTTASATTTSSRSPTSPSSTTDRSHALVGELDHPELGDVVAYDAVHLRHANSCCSTASAPRRQADEITFQVVEGAELPDADAIGMTMTAEQSNTSIAYGEQGILKLFRRISHGDNPDIEIHHALTTPRRRARRAAARLDSAAPGRTPTAAGHTGDLAMLQAFLRTATDGWTIALSSVRDLLVEEDLHPARSGRLRRRGRAARRGDRGDPCRPRRDVRDADPGRRSSCAASRAR